jgi:hypothetical protein
MDRPGSRAGVDLARGPAQPERGEPTQRPAEGEAIEQQAEDAAVHHGVRDELDRDVLGVGEPVPAEDAGQDEEVEDPQREPAALATATTDSVDWASVPTFAMIPATITPYIIESAMWMTRLVAPALSARSRDQVRTCRGRSPDHPRA